LIELEPTEFAGEEARTLGDGHGAGEVNSARWGGCENLVTKRLTICAALVGLRDGNRLFFDGTRDGSSGDLPIA
jgi:hypothetical protein